MSGVTNGERALIGSFTLHNTSVRIASLEYSFLSV